ncbi:TonB-dependent vitamin B12 receptor [Luteimonas sp. 3794]|uniref:TonB-dependent vitamin B12 receptor n=1 Tax=Luteimonas sp. 3794 TaxID=2817730 RepID=UPI00285BC9E5|nr:TonB-dependent vitamin B12 receptor [Luteimonas sp. 3794]MDR6991064.1 vitamin B12 transporter [Luteimonas sp. 3794]
MPFRTLTVAIVAALASPIAAAATAADARDLDTVLVTANRAESTLGDTIVPAQVIDRAEIERTQARDLPELLRGRAGIQIANQGGPGKLSSVFMRGSESDHVLVLVDGVRIGSATAGLASFQDIPVDQIERIEIVRGPRSSLYGSEAIGGVIQIFTRRNTGAVRPHARVGVGSHNLREASAGLGGRAGRGWFGVDAAFQRTDGINACRGRGPLNDDFGAGCFVDEPDRDGYRNRSFNLRGGVELADGLTLEGNALRADAFNEYDGSYGNEAENVQQAAGGKLTYAPSDVVRLTAQAGRSYDKSMTYQRNADAGTRTDFGHLDTRRDTGSLQADFTLAPTQALSLGFDWLSDNVESQTVYAVTQRDNFATFAEYQGRFGAHRLQASARYDDNEQFGGHGTGSIGWGMDLERGLRLNANVGTGFKAPTFNDLYYPGSESPDLKPERSKSANIGVAQYSDSWNWSFNVFESRIDDLIVFVYPPPDFIGTGMNIEEARIRGAELTFATTLAGFDLSTELSHVYPRDRSDSANNGNLLARRARNSGRLDIDRSLGDFRIGTTLRASSSRFDNATNTVRVAGHGTLDLRAAWAFNPDWTLEARATNVLDKDYETIAWYYQPGREYGLALRWSPTAR